MSAPSRTADEIIADWHAGRADHDPYDEIGGLVVEIGRLRAQIRSSSAAWSEVIQREQRSDNAHLHDMDEIRTELAATEGDLGVAIREAAAAREALKLVRPMLESAHVTRLLNVVDAALDQRLTQ